MNSSLRSDANTIIEQSIRAVLPDEAVRRALSGRAFSGRVLLVAAGKAAWQMASAAAAQLGDGPVSYTHLAHHGQGFVIHRSVLTERGDNGGCDPIGHKSHGLSSFLSHMGVACAPPSFLTLPIIKKRPGKTIDG